MLPETRRSASSRSRCVYRVTVSLLINKFLGSLKFALYTNSAVLTCDELFGALATLKDGLFFRTDCYRS